MGLRPKKDHGASVATDLLLTKYGLDPSLVLTVLRRAAYAIVLTVCGSIATGAVQDGFHPDIPKAWDDNEVQSMEVPLAQRDRSPRDMTSAEYYLMKVRPIYRSYPAYAKGREPAGYLESLKEKEPEIIFDPGKLHTKEDWIRAGQLVFESETSYFPAPATQPAAEDIAPLPVSKEGILPYFAPGFRYYIRKKGLLEAGINACAGCHTRVMQDGSFVEGAQGSPQTSSPAKIATIATSSLEASRKRLDKLWVNYGAPWVMDKASFEKSLTREELMKELQAVQAQHGAVFPRQGTSLSHPVRVPALFGIKDFQYLDATGLVRNRSIGDLMRYAILNEASTPWLTTGTFNQA